MARAPSISAFRGLTPGRLRAAARGVGSVDRALLLTLAAYAGLSLLILGPLLAPGYILSLDMVFGPFEPTPNDELWGFDAPVLGAKQIPEAIYFGLSSLMPGDWAQKVILGVMLTAMGLSAHWLSPSRSGAGRFYAGLVFVVNPFVYARLLAGQWFLLLAYAFIPAALVASKRLFDRPSLFRGAVAVFFISLTAFNAHMFALTLGLVLLLGLLELGRRRSARTVAWAGFLFTAVFVINAYWLVPAITANDTVLQQITDLDLIAFATRAHVGSVSVSVLAMYGFWREGYSFLVERAPWMIVLLIPMLWLAVYGASTQIRKPLVLAVAAAAIVGLALATGISGPFDWLFKWMFNNIPYFDAFRDSHKFVALVALGYAVLGSIGFDRAYRWLGERRVRGRTLQITAAVVMLAVPAAYAYPSFWSLGGALGTSQYPVDWAQARLTLPTGRAAPSALLLPWDTYTDYSWVSNSEPTVRTLAKAYFDLPLMFPKNVIKRAGIYGQSSSPEQDVIREILRDGPERSDFGSRISELGAGFVVLSKSGEWQRYNYLDTQSDLTVIFDGPTIKVFASLIPADRAVLSRGGPDDAVPLDLIAVSPARYRLPEGVEGQVKFYPPNGDVTGWKLGGADPVDSSAGYYGLFDSHGATALEYYPARSTLRWAIFSAGASVGLLVLVGWRERVRGRRHGWKRAA